MLLEQRLRRNDKNNKYDKYGKLFNLELGFYYNMCYIIYGSI